MFSANIENNYHGFVPGDAHALRVRDYIKIIQTYTRNDFLSSKARVFILYLFSTLYKQKNNREKYNRKKSLLGDSSLLFIVIGEGSNNVL